MTLGVVVIVASFGVVIAGSVMLWGHVTQRDGHGFLDSQPNRYLTQTYAVTSDDVDLKARPSAVGWIPPQRLAEVRIRADRADGGAVFVGIGPRAQVERYLSRSAHARIADTRLVPFDVLYDQTGGSRGPEQPARQSFWAASASGPGSRQVSWEPKPGEWSVVVMNADASRGVVADLAVAVRAPVLLPMAVAAMALGVLIGALGAVLLVLAARLVRE